MNSHRHVQRAHKDSSITLVSTRKKGAILYIWMDNIHIITWSVHIDTASSITLISTKNIWAQGTQQTQKHYRCVVWIYGSYILAWWLGRSTPSWGFQVRVVRSASLDLCEIKPSRAPWFWSENYSWRGKPIPVHMKWSSLYGWKAYTTNTQAVWKMGIQ